MHSWWKKFNQRGQIRWCYINSSSLRRWFYRSFSEQKKCYRKNGWNGFIMLDWGLLRCLLLRTRIQYLRRGWRRIRWERLGLLSHVLKRRVGIPHRWRCILMYCKESSWQCTMLVYRRCLPFWHDSRSE